MEITTSTAHYYKGGECILVEQTETEHDKTLFVGRVEDVDKEENIISTTVPLDLEKDTWRLMHGGYPTRTIDARVQELYDTFEEEYDGFMRVDYNFGEDAVYSGESEESDTEEEDEGDGSEEEETEE